MAKVYCANVACKFMNDNGVCTSKKIALSYCSVATMNEGRQEYCKCKMFEESDNYKQMKELFQKYNIGV